MALRLATPVAATTPLGCGTRHQVQCIGAWYGRACKSAILRSSRAWIFMKTHSDSYDIHISWRFSPSRFFMTFGPILLGAVAQHKTAVPVEMVSCCPIQNTRTTSIG